MKKRLLKTVLPALLVFAGIFFAISMFKTKNNIERRTNPDLAVLKEGWTGNIVADGKFYDETSPRSVPLGDILKWQFDRKAQRTEKRSDTFRVQVQPFDCSSMPENSIVWLGHASFMINAGGIRLITDPCFFNLPSGRRKVALPAPAGSLKPIRYMLVSHDHRDHFDKRSVRTLLDNNPNIEVLLPLGGSRLLGGKAFGGVARQEAGWWQEYKLKDNLRIIFLPAKHWGRRGLNDFNKTLWGSFLIIAGDTKIFFAGDTAYDGRIFKEIKELFGEMDICLFPIGAYSPPFIMQKAHANPEEAVRAFLDLGGKRLIPMHYGTYDLSDEPPGEPVARLLECADKARIGERIEVLAVGQEYVWR